MNWADKMWDDCFKIATAIHKQTYVPPKPYVPPPDLRTAEQRRQDRAKAFRKDMAMEIYRNESEAA